MMGTHARGPSMLWMQMPHASPVDNWGAGVRLMPIMQDGSEALMVLSCRVGTGARMGAWDRLGLYGWVYSGKDTCAESLQSIHLLYSVPRE